MRTCTGLDAVENWLIDTANRLDDVWAELDGPKQSIARIEVDRLTEKLHDLLSDVQSVRANWIRQLED